MLRFEGDFVCIKRHACTKLILRACSSGILRSLIKAGEGRETSNFAASPLNSAPDKTAILRRLSSEPRAMSERVKLCKLIVKKEKRLIGAGSEKKLG